MPHQVVGLCRGALLAPAQSEPKEETVFVPSSLRVCRHICNWNALHVADWRDNLLAMCFSHSHVMRLGSGCRVFIYILVIKKEKKKENEKNMPAENWKTPVMYEQKGWAGTIHWVLLLYRGTQGSLRTWQGHSLGTHSALKCSITAVTTIYFCMGSVNDLFMAHFILLTWQAILTYWRSRCVVKATEGNGGWQSCLLRRGVVYHLSYTWVIMLLWVSRREEKWASMLTRNFDERPPQSHQPVKDIFAFHN